MTKRDSFLLRLSPEVLDSIRHWADDELRSTNAQIEMILTRALREAGRLPKVKPNPPALNDGESPDQSATDNV